MHVCASIYIIYVVLLVCVCSMYAVIPASHVIGPTGILSGSCPGTHQMSGEPNWVFPIGIYGKGAKRIYPLGRLSGHPCRALGSAALGNNIGMVYVAVC